MPNAAPAPQQRTVCQRRLRQSRAIRGTGPSRGRTTQLAPVLHNTCAVARLALQRGIGLTRSMLTQGLSVLIIDENRIRASIIEDGLRDAGHQRVAVLQDVNDVARTIEATDPDVVVISLENPQRDRLEHFFSLSRAIDRPIAMFVDRSDGAMIEAAVEAGVSAYVVDGLKRERIKPILEMAI